MNWKKIENISKTISGICIIVIVICLFIKAFQGNKKAVPNPEVMYEPVAVVSYVESFELPAEEEKVEAVEQTLVEQIEYKEFIASAYCSCEKCCGVWANNRPNGIVYGAAGRELIQNYSVAVDPNVIPYGTLIYDSNGNEYRADDCGEAIKGNRIDVYFNNHQDALNFGRQTIMLSWED